MSVKCKRCKRPLKSPESVSRGYGYTCAMKEGLIIKKVKYEKKKEDYHSILEYI